jgi:hypothetical protein
MNISADPFSKLDFLYTYLTVVEVPISRIGMELSTTGMCSNPFGRYVGASAYPCVIMTFSIISDGSLGSPAQAARNIAQTRKKQSATLNLNIASPPCGYMPVKLYLECTTLYVMIVNAQR